MRSGGEGTRDGITSLKAVRGGGLPDGWHGPWTGRKTWCREMQACRMKPDDPGSHDVYAKRGSRIIVEPLVVTRHFQASQLQPVVVVVVVGLLRGPHTVGRLARTRSSDLHRLPPLGKTGAFVVAFAFLARRSLVRGGNKTVNRNLAYGRAGRCLLQGQGAAVWGARLP